MRQASPETFLPRRHAHDARAAYGVPVTNFPIPEDARVVVVVVVVRFVLAGSIDEDVFWMERIVIMVVRFILPLFCVFF